MQLSEVIAPRDDLAMREWSLNLAPVMATMYFLIYPDQLHKLLTSLTSLMELITPR